MKKGVDQGRAGNASGRLVSAVGRRWPGVRYEGDCGRANERRSASPAGWRATSGLRGARCDAQVRRLAIDRAARRRGESEEVMVGRRDGFESVGQDEVEG